MNYHSYRDAIFASDLTVQQKMVAQVIAYHYNWKTKSPAFPSNLTIAKEAGVSVRTVVRSKQELVSRGFLIQERRHDNTSLYVPVSPGYGQSDMGYGQSDMSEVSEWPTNNEYNNELNNEINNEIKDSKESLDNINYKELEVVEYSSTLNEQPLTNKRSEPAPAALQEEWLSW